MNVSELPSGPESARYYKTILDAKDRIFRRFDGKNREGLETSRVEKFIRGKGLVIKPYMIVQEGEIPELAELVQGIRLFDNLLTPEPIGGHIAFADFVVLKRGGNLEQLNGKGFTEGVLAHELLHAASTQVRFEDYPPNLPPAYKTSFYGWNSFLEEGLAALVQTEYMTGYIPDFLERKKRLIDLPIASPDDTIPIPLLGNPGVAPFPIKYFHIDQINGKLQLKINPITMGAFGLELLCRKDDRVSSLLLEARSFRQNYGRLARVLNEIDPQLFARMHFEYQATENEYFTSVFGFIATHVYNGWPEVIKAEGELMEYWKKIINKS